MERSPFYIGVSPDEIAKIDVDGTIVFACIEVKFRLAGSTILKAVAAAEKQGRVVVCGFGDERFND